MGVLCVGGYYVTFKGVCGVISYMYGVVEIIQVCSVSVSGVIVCVSITFNLYVYV